jgi:hypothetical protein
MKILNESGGFGDFTYFDLKHPEKAVNEQNDQKVLELTFTRNYLVLVSNEKNFPLEFLSDKDFRDKKRFCFLAFMTNEERRSVQDFPKLKTVLNIESFKFNFMKSMWINIYVHPVEKITTYIR